MNPAIQLLKFLSLIEFPSGSSINYYQDKLYLIGDDATHILILDNNYNHINSIQLFDSQEKRISKQKKADLEASTVVTIKDKDYLLILGSGSRDERKKLILIPMIELNIVKNNFEIYECLEFINRLVSTGIKDVNIEGITSLGEALLLANRGNTSNPCNHLIVTDKSLWNNQKNAPIHTIELLFQPSAGVFIGVSDITYLQSADVLLLTLSSEDTKNSYDDGVIGSSYIGWINNASQKLNQHHLTADGLINLPEALKEFEGEKIEGICVESVFNETLILHLASDNDRGETKLFKIKVDLNRQDPSNVV